MMYMYLLRACMVYRAPTMVPRPPTHRPTCYSLMTPALLLTQSEEGLLANACAAVQSVTGSYS
eukprot:scaffold874_cov380-Prasinococcus_capsulatus_cf.AAC.10